MVVPQRHPVLTAKMLATIDVLSKGRLIVGCGVGWLKEEFEALGAPPFAERGRATDEYLDAMKALWTQDAPKFAGKHASFDDVIFAPKPVRKPHPPIWIGGESAVALKRTVRVGDGWYPASNNPQHRLDTPERLAAGVAELHSTAKAAGRDPEDHRHRLPRALAGGLDRAQDGRRRPPPVHRQLGATWPPMRQRWRKSACGTWR